MKIANIAKEFLHIFRTTRGNSTKFSGKISFKIILKVTRKQGFWFNSVADNLSVSFKLNLCFNELYINVFPVNFSCQICTIDQSREIAATSAVWPQLFCSKNRKRTYFLNRYHKEKSLPAACRITKFETSHKLQTQYMTPCKEVEPFDLVFKPLININLESKCSSWQL